MRSLPFLAVIAVAGMPLNLQAQQTTTALADPAGQAVQAANPAASADPNQPKPVLSTTDTVTVVASGETRDEQSISSKVLLDAAPGTSPIAILARLPSVSVTSADPYGAYEWALRISVRGFNQNQLGFTLDEVPLGDMSYGNLNGLHISRAIIDENLGDITLSQGTASLETASTSNLGGAVQFFSAEPDDRRHLDIRQSGGSWNTVRTYGKFDSGKMRYGTKFYVSGVYQHGDKWKGQDLNGNGQIGQHYYQFNGRLTQPVGSQGLFTFFADYSNRAEVDYQDLNKVWTHQLGYKWDNNLTWGQALQTANAYNFQGQTGLPVFSNLSTSFPAPINSLQTASGDLTLDPQDAAYYGASGLRKDFLSYASYKTAIGTHYTFKLTAYGHRNDGRGLWFTPYLSSFDNFGNPVSPISLRTSEYGITRGGFLTSVAWESGRNRLEGGGWFEKESFDLARRFYGTTLASPVHSLYSFPSNPFYTQWAYNFPSTVYQLHLQDSFKVKPSLTLAAGFKAVETNQTGNLTGFNQGLNLAPSTLASKYAQGSLQSGGAFLPQLGVDWKFRPNDEMFADVAENARAFQAGGPGFGTSPWGTSQAGFNALTSNLKSERSWSEEVGYRHSDNKLQLQANYFHVNFSNRLLAIQQGPSIAGNASLLSNVGGVTTNGVDGAASYRLNGGWTLYNGLTYSRSTYDSNYITGGNTILTGGKVVVDAPQFLWKNSLAYNRGAFDAHIGSDFMSRRYFTYTDDNFVDGRFLADFGTSYHIDEAGVFNQLRLQFNIYNLANATYYSTVGTNGFIASDPTSVSNNTLQVGAPRTYSGTFSVRF